jgi:sodium/potassium-transporting ATPase subunit alpha
MQIDQRDLLTQSERDIVGLSEAEAKRLLNLYGPNEIKKQFRSPLIVKFFQQFTHFLALLLWIAALLAFISNFLHSGEGMQTLGWAIIGVIFINAIFTFTQEYRTEKSIEALRRLLPFEVKVYRDGKEKLLPASILVPGDLIRLEEGDKVPADTRIVRSTRLTVSNASLTGESAPLLLTPYKKGFEEDVQSTAYAGTIVIGGSGEGIVFATGMDTEFGRIAKLTGTVEFSLSPLQKEIQKTTRIIAVLSVFTGFVFFAIGHLIGRPFWANLLFGIGIIVANVPEGLLPTMTLALAMGSQRMARKKALLKKLSSVETLGSVSVICTDKTGTLTQNSMSVKSLWVSGTSYDPESNLSSDTKMLLYMASLCNDARYVDGHYRGDSTEVALLKARGVRTEEGKYSRIGEIPFDPDRKRMTTFHNHDDSVLAITKGAPEDILNICDRVLWNAIEIKLEEKHKNRILQSNQEYMNDGLRILAFSYRNLDEIVQSPTESEQKMIFAGLIAIEDPPRPEVPGAIAKCQKAGIRLIMITGDGAGTALAVAREIGLANNNPVLVEGKTLDELNDREAFAKLQAKEVVLARTTPRHKMRVVSLLKQAGERVAVTGDGVNDAPALRKADIGIAMGQTGTDVAKEAADMILLDDNFATIVNAIEEGRAVYENIRKFITYIFSSNVPEIVPYIAYILFRIPLPLTIIQILAVDLGTDMLPALALGAEKPTTDLMEQPPRNPKEKLLNSKILTRAYLFLGPIEAAAGLFGFFTVLKAGGWQWGEMMEFQDPLYIKATTACLTGIVLTQVANVFACRSLKDSIFRIGFFSNPFIFLGILFELLLLAFFVYHPWGNNIFGTSPIPTWIWLVLAPFAVLLLTAEELRKKLVKTHLLHNRNI